MRDTTRINEQIRETEVRLIDAAGEHVGVVPIAEALAMAKAAELDLVEIADKTDPHVCRIMDYGHFKYDKTKKQKEAKKKQRVIVVKEMSFRPSTDDHDYAFKLRHIREFLNEGNKVRVAILYRGREMAHKEVGARQLKRLMDDIADIATVEQPPQFEGRRLAMSFAPIPSKITGGKRAKAENETGSGKAVQADKKRQDQEAQSLPQPHPDQKEHEAQTQATPS